MKVNSLLLDQYRNIDHMEFSPVSGVNVIYGENAQGKTNLLEAIWLFTGLRSFRGSKEKEQVRFGQKQARLEMNYFNDVREQTAVITINEKKKASVGGVSYPSCSALCGEFLGVIFSPGHLSLIQGGPTERRKFLNQALCQLRPNYAGKMTQYHHILQQRNILLKDITYHSELLDTLDVWDETLAALSASLIWARKQYLTELTGNLKEFYGGISGGREEISLSYLSAGPLEGTSEAQLQEEMKLLIQNSRKEDLIAGYTTVGPHRDDLEIRLNGLPAKNFGSQGQQRSCALSLKMAEAAIVHKTTGKQPVALLDDVMSELDSSRQDYLLNHIEGWQVFITCCEPSHILLSKTDDSGNLFELKGGHLCSST